MILVSVLAENKCCVLMGWTCFDGWGTPGSRSKDPQFLLDWWSKKRGWTPPSKECCVSPRVPGGCDLGQINVDLTCPQTSKEKNSQPNFQGSISSPLQSPASDACDTVLTGQVSEQGQMKQDGEGPGRVSYGDHNGRNHCFLIPKFHPWADFLAWSRKKYWHWMKKQIPPCSWDKGSLLNSCGNLILIIIDSIKRWGLKRQLCWSERLTQ